MKLMKSQGNNCEPHKLRILAALAHPSAAMNEQAA